MQSVPKNESQSYTFYAHVVDHTTQDTMQIAQTQYNDDLFISTLINSYLEHCGHFPYGFVCKLVVSSILSLFRQRLSDCAGVQGFDLSYYIIFQEI